jgi:hypothetical protein
VLGIYARPSDGKVNRIVMDAAEGNREMRSVLA